MRDTIQNLRHLVSAHPVLAYLIPVVGIVGIGCAYALQLLEAFRS